MTVLVTGATGFLGTSLVNRLLSEHERVRILVRSPLKARRFTDRGVELVVGDIADRTVVSTAVEGVRIIYHLAGRLLAPGVTATEYERTHLTGTAHVLACCEKASDLERLVHCSTTGVLGVTGERPAGEAAPIRPTNVYEATKAAAEAAVRDATSRGVPAVIARPGLVYGPGDLHLLPFFRAVLGGRFRPIGRRPVSLHPIYIDDMSEALVRCGQHQAIAGECFHFAGREPVSLAGLAAAIARAGGTRLPQGYIPLRAARAAATLGDRLPAKLKPIAPLTRSRLDFLTHSRVYDVTKAKRLLGFVAQTDLPIGAEQTMAWYREQGYLPEPAGDRR